MFPVRYKLHLYIFFRTNSVFIGFLRKVMLKLLKIDEEKAEVKTSMGVVLNKEKGTE
jgi:hypothetical protein